MQQAALDRRPGLCTGRTEIHIQIYGVSKKKTETVIFFLVTMVILFHIVILR